MRWRRCSRGGWLGLLAWLQVFGGFLVISSAQQATVSSSHSILVLIPVQGSYSGKFFTKQHSPYIYSFVHLVIWCVPGLLRSGPPHRSLSIQYCVDRQLPIFFLFFMSVLVSPLIDRGYFRLYFEGGWVIALHPVLRGSAASRYSFFSS